MDERLPKEVHVSLNEDGTLSTSFPPFPDWFDGVMGLVVGQRYVPEALLAEAVREQRLQTMKDIVKLLHLTNGKEHGIRCVEDCISALEAASTEGGKGGE